LGGRKGIRPVKNKWWSAGVVVCLQQGADLHMAQLMPLPLTITCFRKIQIGFTFLVPAYLGSPGKRAIKRVCVWHQLDHMQTISTLLLVDKHTNSSSLNFYRPNALPDAKPTVSEQEKHLRPGKLVMPLKILLQK